MQNNCVTPLNNYTKKSNDIDLLLKMDTQAEIKRYGVEKKLNDYIGVQKAIIPRLEEEGFFQNVVNEESGMVIEITRKKLPITQS